MAKPIAKPQNLKSRCRALIGERHWRQARRQLFRLRYRFSRFPTLTLDNMIVTESQHVFTSGHLLDPDNQVVDIELWLNNDSFINIAKDIRRYVSGRFKVASELLPNCDKPAFAFHVPFKNEDENSSNSDNSAVEPCGVRLHLHNGQRQLIRYKHNTLSTNALTTVRSILQSMPISLSGRRVIFTDVFGPAIHNIWHGRMQPDKKETLVRCNNHLQAQKPDVSLIIPIYGRYDFIEHQLAQFVNDTDMELHEIIYVIDDPRLYSAVMDNIKMLEKIYQIAFNVLFLQNNLGYAGANNSGVRHASANTLLLLNSDVLPTKPGWLQALLKSSVNDLKDNIVGARLIYEDNTIQHNGMRFYASPFADDLWINLHPAKGFPAALVPASQSLVDCESVTGACLLISRDNYLAINGLDENYILGDFEDSDFCLKARQHGLGIKLAETVVLYHLERQSQSLVSDKQWKSDLTYYNCWYHSQKWDSTIRQMKTDTA